MPLAFNDDDDDNKDKQTKKNTFISFFRIEKHYRQSDDDERIKQTSVYNRNGWWINWKKRKEKIHLDVGDALNKKQNKKKCEQQKSL